MTPRRNGSREASDARKVLEYWRRDGGLDWVRDQSLEVDLDADWSES